MERAANSIRQFFSRLFVSGSPEAADINSLFQRYLILAGFIVALVAGLVIVGAIRYRARQRSGEPAQVSGNKSLEILWTVLPFAAVSYFFILTVITMKQINQPFQAGQKPDIVIIAHQWWWDMRYPQYNIITANELHIPAGEKMLMRVESADVIHDWWVPELGRKIDAVPGHVNYTWIEADKPGTYEGTCSEYCGAQHAWMRIRVIAQPPADFERWVKSQQAVPGLPADSLGRAGAYLFQQKTCASCHEIVGTSADAHIGPDLTHLASRETILSGKLPNTRDNLALWLQNPQKVKEGAHMPDFMLSHDEITALVSYLEGLK
jgi:cytochrome c oxidase subunit 2